MLPCPPWKLSLRPARRPERGSEDHDLDGTMRGYYSKKLSGERLRLCYEIAPPRVQRYLRSEIEFVKERIPRGARVLEMGCGYGRVLEALIPRAGRIVGIDTSRESLRLARESLGGAGNVHLAAMDAARLALAADQFDVALCIQNGISVFQVDKRDLMREALRVLGPGGVALLSSYSPRFWEHRLEWFHRQAARGLLGKIDTALTGDGTIVCEDGFRSTTTATKELLALAQSLDIAAAVTEVDASSIFCEIHKPEDT